MLIKYYRNSILIPAGLMLLVYLIVSLLGGFAEASWESEMRSDAVFYTVLFLAIIFHALCMGVLALPLFLNKYEKVRKHTLLSVLLWFSAPILWTTGILLKNWDDLFLYNFSWYYYMSSHALLYGSVFPYLAGLLITYRQFRRNIK